VFNDTIVGGAETTTSMAVPATTFWKRRPAPTSLTATRHRHRELCVVGVPWRSACWPESQRLAMRRGDTLIALPTSPQRFNDILIVTSPSTS